MIDVAREEPVVEHDTQLDGWLPSRALVYRDDDVEEIWCAISVRAVDGNFIRPQVRLLFAALEEHLAPAVFEARGDWPIGDVGWFEAVRLGMR